MNNSSWDVLLWTMWVNFALISLAGILFIILWAVRKKQFKDQRRARHLPLLSRYPDDDGGAPEPQKRICRDKKKR